MQSCSMQTCTMSKLSTSGYIPEPLVIFSGVQVRIFVNKRHFSFLEDIWDNSEDITFLFFITSSSVRSSGLFVCLFCSHCPQHGNLSFIIYLFCNIEMWNELSHVILYPFSFSAMTSTNLMSYPCTPGNLRHSLNGMTSCMCITFCISLLPQLNIFQLIMLWKAQILIVCFGDDWHNI